MCSCVVTCSWQLICLTVQLHNLLLSVTRLHRWHLHEWSLTCFCHLPSGGDITVQLQNRCVIHESLRTKREGELHPFIMWTELSSLSKRFRFEHGEGLDRAWRHRGHCEDSEQREVLHWILYVLPWRYGVIMNTYYIMNYTAQSQTFINTFCTESRRSSENDSQSSNVPGFLKLAWSFKQLPKVRRCAIVHMFEKYRTLFKENLLTFDWNTSVTATPNQVRHGVPPGSAPAAVSQVLRRVWVIRSVTIQISLILLSVSFISSLWLVLFCNRCPYTLSPF